MAVIVNAPKRAISPKKANRTTQATALRDLGINKAVQFDSGVSARVMASFANGFLTDRQFSAYLATDGKHYVARIA